MKIKRISYGIAALALGLSMILGLATSVFAVHDQKLFELDADAIDSNSAADLPDDWSTLNAGGGHAKSFTGILPDIGANGGTQFQGGGSKDDLDISQWLWKLGEPLDKDDITDAYAAAYVAQTTTGTTKAGDLLVYFGLDRFSTAGSAQVGFWFLQDPTFGLTNIASGGGFKFNGVHQNNDVLVQSNFSNGGVINNITVYKWQNGALVKVLDAADCGISAADDLACAIVNKSPTTSPWSYTPKANEGPAGTFGTSAFFEGGINLSALIPDAGCFTGFMAETRSSTPFDSRLKDFVLGDFDLCSIKVTKTGDTLSKIGDPVDYTVTIKNTGSITLYKDSIDDNVLGIITTGGVDQTNTNVVSNGCGASLAPDATCTITLRRTVLASDPDPLPNTVTATYRGKAALTGIAISGTDDHSVNLFQPSFTLSKTGDTLSKIGDKVDYIITLTNTSSADTPDLTCTVTDPTVGVDETFTIASGAAAHVINVTDFTIPVSASDPFVNTASASCSPAGFPNVLTKTASYSVNLFQPDVSILKGGTILSKVGDSVTYNFRLTNSSSADTPAMNCTATDSLVGQVFKGALPIGFADYTAKYTIKETDPDPLPNTVTLTCSPDGFPNVLTKTSSHEVNLFQPSITLTKTGNDLSKIGDKVDYVITLANTSSTDTPDLTCTVTDPTVGVNDTFTIASGAADHVINVKDFVIPADASDPFTNTASATCSPTGFPNVLTKTASHDVELFQPSITLTKTGDALSKIGDKVNYVITLGNTSSADTPDLNCTVTDPTVGVNDTFTIASGAADHVINVKDFVIPADASDPFTNTASVTCSPTGFPNVLTKTASHDIELFQPSITLTKTGDALSKIGDKVNYVITLGNTSSADTPDLNCTVTDPTVGVNDTFTIASGAADHVINVKDFVIPAAAGDPFTNTASVTCSPTGFPNVLTKTASHDIELFQPAITLTKTGDALSKIGDKVNYVITLGNTSSADTPDLNCTVTDPTVGVNDTFTIASGAAAHVINVTDFVIPANASDPFTNTASATCSPTGFPNVLEKTASHDVDLFQPAITLTKTGDALSKIGDKVNYVITLGNTSSADTPDLNCTVTDTTVGVNDTFTIASGAADHVINVTDFVIPANASDPFTTTASATCSPTGFPNVLEKTASHDIDLFQPAFSVSKTGDALSKVGDPVDYTITLTNNSSADTPAMTCTATDTLLGSVFSGVLPLGDTVINKTRTVLAGDKDPLVNTVNVTCSLAGFPNVLTGSSSHSTNLFQPAVEVVKSGPTTAAVGDTITYHFVITNKSSADSPNLILDSVTDTVIGSLTSIAAANGCSSLAPSGTCSFDAPYTIKGTDPNPLVNVVTVHYHPANFPNDIKDDDNHSLTIIYPNGCTPGFWQGGAGAPLWDEVNDPQWVYGGTNPYIHTKLFNDYFNVLTSSVLDGKTMMDIVGSGGTSDPVLKAARDLVAAYLNESAFPATYPVSSLNTLTSMWYSALAGGDTALAAFHTQVGGWNSEVNGVTCPLP